MKIGLFITARLKSSRLPFKLLRDLNGYNIIEHVINRSKQVYGIDGIVLCTSTNKQDKPLVDVAFKNEIYYFLGSEKDVLQRLADAADFFGYDYLVSITGENPLFSIDHANMLVDKMKLDKDDFILINGLPIGCAVYGIRTNALKTVCQIKKEIDTEIWGPLINRPEIFKVGKLQVEEFYNRPEIRFTNDYFEDFVMMNTIFQLFPPHSSPSLYSVLKLIDENPEILKINQMRRQLNLDDQTLEKIDRYYIENFDRISETKNKIYFDDI